MAWQKYATQHVPEWLSVRMTGLRESIEHIGFFAVSGLIAGLLYGSAIGWLKYDDLNAHQIARDKWQQAVERNNETWVEFCEDNPKSLQCGDNLKRLCKAQPDAAACKDYRTGSQARITQQGRPMAALLTWGLNMDTLHQLAFAATAYAVPAAFFAAVGAGMLYGIIRPSALSL